MLFQIFSLRKETRFWLFWGKFLKKIRKPTFKKIIYFFIEVIYDYFSIEVAYEFFMRISSQGHEC